MSVNMLRKQLAQMPPDAIEEGYWMLSKLSTHFRVQIPLLEFDIGRSRHRGRYYPSVNLIEIYVAGDWRNTLLHEFAHHLDKGSEARSHGKPFCAHLYKIVDFWYKGHIGKYSWDTEYKTVQRYPEWRRIKTLKLEQLKKKIENLE